VDNVYSFAPGAAERIQYSREYEDSKWPSREALSSRSREKPNLVMPPDPEGWQIYVERLQMRANALRRGQTDTGEVLGTWPRTDNSEPGR
jgi:hypothetical protein